MLGLCCCVFIHFYQPPFDHICICLFLMDFAMCVCLHSSGLDSLWLCKYTYHPPLGSVKHLSITRMCWGILLIGFRRCKFHLFWLILWCIIYVEMQIVRCTFGAIRWTLLLPWFLHSVSCFLTLASAFTLLCVVEPMLLRSSLWYWKNNDSCVQTVCLAIDFLSHFFRIVGVKTICYLLLLLKLFGFWVAYGLNKKPLLFHIFYISVCEETSNFLSFFECNIMKSLCSSCLAITLSVVWPSFLM